MRRVAFLALSFAVFGTAIGLNRQNDPPAGQVFRNIQSFKDEKASAIIPAMEFMSASLGVGCDYCHTADRASDEKRAKGAARMMIAMQRDINAKNFGGRSEISCATCHAGHTHPVPTPPVAGLSDRPHRADGVVPTDVMAAYAKAVGGDPRRPLDPVRITGTEIANGQKSAIDAVYSGGKYAYLIHAAKGDQRFGFDGTSAWFTTPKGTQSIPLVYAVSRVNEMAFMAGPAALPKFDGAYGLTATINGHDQLVVSGTMADKTRVTLFLDKATGYLTRSAYYYPTVLGSIAQIDDYSNYRKVNGTMIPLTMAVHDSEGDKVYEFRSVRVDASITPAELQPAK